MRGFSRLSGRASAPGPSAVRGLAGLALLAALLLALPAPARAAAPAADSAAIRGWVCTPLGCGPPASAPLSRAAGFGAAVLAIVWISRRSR